MRIWQHCSMATYYPGADAAEVQPCVVKISDGEILVEYQGDGLVQYRGPSLGTGHYSLEAPAVDGRASLHGFAGSTLLEGSWVQGSYRGMWKIELA